MKEKKGEQNVKGDTSITKSSRKVADTNQLESAPVLWKG